MLRLRVQAKEPISGSWENWEITVHNRTELLDWVENTRTFGYRTFGLYLENGTTLLEISQTRIYWHKTVGFRP